MPAWIAGYMTCGLRNLLRYVECRPQENTITVVFVCGATDSPLQGALFHPKQQMHILCMQNPVLSHKSGCFSPHAACKVALKH